MASIVWNRDPQEAMDNPYEYNAQDQFHREAISLCNKISDAILNKKIFYKEDRSLEKAIWMLQTDALFAFRDSILLLHEKNHRIVGRLLRDMLETVHLIEYFNTNSTKSYSDLEEWYDDKPIMHREYRNYIKNTFGHLESETKKSQHRVFSKFTHRTYKSLLYGYILGATDRIIYDDKISLVPTIAMYYAILGTFGLYIVDNLKLYGILTLFEIEKAWNESIESFQIPRGWMSEEQKRFFGIDAD
jgi:hypothetical protein